METSGSNPVTTFCLNDCRRERGLLLTSFSLVYYPPPLVPPFSFALFSTLPSHVSARFLPETCSSTSLPSSRPLFFSLFLAPFRFLSSSNAPVLSFPLFLSVSLPIPLSLSPSLQLHARSLVIFERIPRTGEIYGGPARKKRTVVVFSFRGGLICYYVLFH